VKVTHTVTSLVSRSLWRLFCIVGVLSGCMASSNPVYVALASASREGMTDDDVGVEDEETGGVYVALTIESDLENVPIVS